MQRQEPCVHAARRGLGSGGRPRPSAARPLAERGDACDAQVIPSVPRVNTFDREPHGAGAVRRGKLDHFANWELLGVPAVVYVVIDPLGFTCVE